MITAAGPILDVAFANTMAAPREARRRLRQLLEAVHPANGDDVELVASELVTNAVMHGGGAQSMRVWRRADELRIEVTDRSPELPRRVEPAPDGGGRGIRLVETLADAWGMDIRAGVKTIWCEVRLRS